MLEMACSVILYDAHFVGTREGQMGFAVYVMCTKSMSNAQL